MIRGPRKKLVFWVEYGRKRSDTVTAEHHLNFLPKNPSTYEIKIIEKKFGEIEGASAQTEVFVEIKDLKKSL